MGRWKLQGPPMNAVIFFRSPESTGHTSHAYACIERDEETKSPFPSAMGVVGSVLLRQKDLIGEGRREEKGGGARGVGSSPQNVER